MLQLACQLSCYRRKKLYVIYYASTRYKVC